MKSLKKAATTSIHKMETEINRRKQIVEKYIWNILILNVDWKELKTTWNLLIQIEQIS